MTDNSPMDKIVSDVSASRRRLVLAADADRREIERALHEGVQQRLVALAVNLQLARQSADADPEAVKELLDQMGRDVQQALDETGQLAQRINPPLDAGGLAAALRSAAMSAGVRASVDVGLANYPPEVATTIHHCWLEALEHAVAQPTMSVRDEKAELTFEIDGTEIPEDGLERLRDRVDALGGSLSRSGMSISGSLPLEEAR